ncbi:MAG: ABC transporter substrate-binding protein [Candidatus Jettenia caeni]|nr:ABC transporter substrate-binding protein [Candidatus Jettenia caeni]
MVSIKGLEPIQRHSWLNTGMSLKIFVAWILATIAIFYLKNHVSAGTVVNRQLTPQERQGKQIYLLGSSASGREITALLGNDTTEVPASALPCVSCHGYDGKGRPEGGVLPSDITGDFLMKPYGITHPNGRRHPPYTDRFLRRAIIEGIDPSGNKLSPVMPVYRFTREEVNNLIVYLKRLGKEKEPGVTDTSILVGAILPGKGFPSEMAMAMKEVLQSYFHDLNEQGGIYNRRIELRFSVSGDTPAATQANAMSLLEEEVFVINGAFIEGSEREIDVLIQEREIPLVGAITNFPQVDFPLNRYIFYLFSGVKELSLAMVEFASEKFGAEDPHIAILSAGGEVFSEITHAIDEQCKKNGWDSRVILTYPHDQFEAKRLVREMKEKEIDAIFFLCSGNEQKALLSEAGRFQWRPFVFIPGPLIDKEILTVSAGFKDKIFLSFPRGPSDMIRASVKEYHSFAEKHKIPAQHLSVQIEAYCSAKILAEGLKRAGKDVSRERLVAVLEGLYEFETGLTPQITFGPNRRIGALGAYIALVDPEEKKVISASDWVKLQ